MSKIRNKKKYFFKSEPVGWWTTFFKNGLENIAVVMYKYLLSICTDPSTLVSTVTSLY